MQTIDQLVRTAMPEPITKAKTPAITPLNLDKYREWLGLNTFDDPELEKLANRSAEWLDAWRTKQAPRWLTILGEPGTGKTHTAKKLWQWTRARSDFRRTLYQPHVIYWPDFVQRLRSGQGYELRDDLKDWPVLFLDDIGAQHDPTGFATDELSVLLNARLDKWTLITTNLNAEGLKTLDRRIASRLIRERNICVTVKTKDYATRS